MATLRCTMAGSFFGIVLPKVCYYTPTKVRVIIIRELIAIASKILGYVVDAFIHSGKGAKASGQSGLPHLSMHADVSFWAVTLSHRLAYMYYVHVVHVLLQAFAICFDC